MLPVDSLLTLAPQWFYFLLVFNTKISQSLPVSTYMYRAIWVFGIECFHHGWESWLESREPVWLCVDVMFPLTNSPVYSGGHLLPWLQVLQKRRQKTQLTLSCIWKGRMGGENQLMVGHSLKKTSQMINAYLHQSLRSYQQCCYWVLSYLISLNKLPNRNHLMLHLLCP